jgi:hypothetical protein
MVHRKHRKRRRTQKNSLKPSVSLSSPLCHLRLIAQSEKVTFAVMFLPLSWRLCVKKFESVKNGKTV